MAIIQTAAKLMTNDIISLDVLKSSYPLPDDISDPSTNLDFVPDSLQLFMHSVFVGKNAVLEVASIDVTPTVNQTTKACPSQPIRSQCIGC